MIFSPRGGGAEHGHRAAGRAFRDGRGAAGIQKDKKHPFEVLREEYEALAKELGINPYTGTLKSFNEYMMLKDKRGSSEAGKVYRAGKDPEAPALPMFGEVSAEE